MIDLSWIIALAVLFSFIILHCSSATSGLVLLLTGITSTLRSVFETRPIRLIAQKKGKNKAPVCKFHF